MGVAFVSDMQACAGRPLSSPPGLTADAAPQVTDEEAASEPFIPADSLSAVLISPHRILVTGGVLADERVLPLTVVRFLDLDISQRSEHAWTRPLTLRTRVKRKRPDSAFPVCRMEQTLTYVPEASSLFLIGGLKVGGKDEAMACKTLFAFDIGAKVWECVEVQSNRACRDNNLGPRFAHLAIYVPRIGGERRSSKARKSSGYILVHGGYVSTEADEPCRSVHIFDVRLGQWSLRSAAQDSDAPRRAYHAGVATASFRYFVAHGGQCSHLEDTGFLSSDLIIFDISRSRWVRPNLLPSSCTPPTARKRHCMVNGTGKHTGAILLYGGELSSGSYSNELFVLRVIESDSGDQYLDVIWEKVELGAFERRISHMETYRDQELDNRTGKRNRERKHDGSAGGSLLAIPSLKKYLLIGGRGEYGIRHCPFLLDASGVETIDYAKGNIEDETFRGGTHGEAFPLGVTSRTSIKKEEKKLGSTRFHSRPRNRNELRAAMKNSVGESTQKSQCDAHLQQLNIHRIPESPCFPGPTSGQFPEEANLSVSPVCKPATNSVLQREAFGIGRLASRKRCISNTQSKIETSMENENTVDAGHKEDSVKVSGTLPPNKRARSSVRTANERACSTSDQNSIIEGLRGIREEKLASSKDHEFGNCSEGQKIQETRRRRLTRTMNVCLPEQGDDSSLAHHHGSTPISEFVAASELAERGKRNDARPIDGRGRRQIVRSKKRMPNGSADDIDCLKSKQTDELLKSVEQIRSLQAENLELRQEKDAFKKDNLDLNYQMKSVLTEVEQLRASSREHRRLSNISSQNPEFSQRKSSRIETSHSSSRMQRQNSSKEERSGGNSEELQMLQSKTADLLEEYEDIVAEKTELRQHLKEAEDGRGALQTELHSIKNKNDQLENDRDKLRQQLRELRALVTELRVSRDSGCVEIRKMEEKISSMKRDSERLRGQLSELNGKYVEEKLQSSTFRRLADSVQHQLTEARKRHDYFDSTEKRHKSELEFEVAKVSELQTLFEDTKGELQKAQEVKLNINTELESLRKEYERSQNGYERTLRDLEKSRSDLHQERKVIVRLEGEVVKGKRDLNRIQRERDNLRRYVSQRESALVALRPVLHQVTKEIDVMMSVGQDSDYSCKEPEIDAADERDEQRLTSEQRPAECPE